MENHWKLSDDEFEQQFASLNFEPEFSHEAHLRLAYIHLKKYGLDDASSNIDKQLSAYVKFQGAEDKYNLTLTLAAVNIVDHFMNKDDSGSFKELIQIFPRLKNNFIELIRAHYSDEVFTSKEAKVKYLEPDKLSFD